MTFSEISEKVMDPLHVLHFVKSLTIYQHWQLLSISVLLSHYVRLHVQL